MLERLPAALRAPAMRWDRAALGLLALNAIFDAINVITFFGAMDHTTVAVAVLTHYLTPILVALAAPHIDGVRVPGAGVAAVVATAGLTLVLEPWRGAAGVWVGGGLGALSAVAYAGNVFTVARLTPRIGAARTVAYHSFGSALLLAPFAGAAWREISVEDLLRLTAGSWTIGALAGAAFVTGLSMIGSARAAILTFCEPMVAVLVGILIWHEPASPLAGVGAVLILGAGIHVARGRG